MPNQEEDIIWLDKPRECWPDFVRASEYEFSSVAELNLLLNTLMSSCLLVKAIIMPLTALSTRMLTASHISDNFFHLNISRTPIKARPISNNDPR
jgi:hypothetical protein